MCTWDSVPGTMRATKVESLAQVLGRSLSLSAKDRTLRKHFFLRADRSRTTRPGTAPPLPTSVFAPVGTCVVGEVFDTRLFARVFGARGSRPCTHLQCLLAVQLVPKDNGDTIVHGRINGKPKKRSTDDPAPSRMISLVQEGKSGVLQAPASSEIQLCHEARKRAQVQKGQFPLNGEHFFLPMLHRTRNTRHRLGAVALGG